MSIVRTLNAHAERYCAGFYLSSVAYSGRAFEARTVKGQLQVRVGSDWLAVGADARWWNHNGRPIGNLPFKA